MLPVVRESFGDTPLLGSRGLVDPRGKPEDEDDEGNAEARAAVGARTFPWDRPGLITVEVGGEMNGG